MKIKTNKDIEKRKSFIGKLLDFKDGIVTVETEGGSFSIPYADVEKANLELDF